MNGPARRLGRVAPQTGDALAGRYAIYLQIFREGSTIRGAGALRGSHLTSEPGAIAYLAHSLADAIPVDTLPPNDWPILFLQGAVVNSLWDKS